MTEDTAHFVARHDPGISHEALAERVRQGVAALEALREVLPKRSRSLRGFAREAHDLAGYFHLLEPDSPEVLLFLRLMARAIAADAARTIPGGGPVRVDLGKIGPIELPPHELPDPLPSLRQIVYAYHAAFAAGDKPALALLADAPIELVVGAPPNAEERAYMLPHALGLQRLARGDIAGNQLLLDAIKGCESPSMVPVTRDYARFLVSPEIELALLHAQSDQESRSAGLPTFDEALRNALILHRRYWRDFEPNPGERQANDPQGFIALGPLAWATLRHDRGLAVTVTSDYLPRSVIESRQHGSSGPA
jgi:hypothetical protein